MMATLDILIPHYNDPEGLALSLRSIARQSWDGEKRIVVADDGSRPDLRRAVAAIAENSEMNIVPIYNPINRGRPYTRNVLLDAIDSPYVAWLDAGDEWYPRKLSVQFDHLHLVESAHLSRPFWITCNYDWAWAGRRKKKIAQRTDQDQVKGLLVGSSLRAYLWTLLAPAHCFKDVGWFDERLPRLQDLDFFIRFLLHGGDIKNVRDGNAFCIYHKSDVGRDANEVRACSQRIFEKHLVLYNRYGENFKAMRLYNMEFLAARFAANNSSKQLTRRYMWRAFKTKPKVFSKHVLKNGLKV